MRLLFAASQEIISALRRTLVSVVIRHSLNTFDFGSSVEHPFGAFRPVPEFLRPACSLINELPARCLAKPKRQTDFDPKSYVLQEVKRCMVFWAFLAIDTLAILGGRLV